MAPSRKKKANFNKKGAAPGRGMKMLNENFAEKLIE